MKEDNFKYQDCLTYVDDLSGCFRRQRRAMRGQGRRHLLNGESSHGETRLYAATVEVQGASERGHRWAQSVERIQNLFEVFMQKEKGEKNAQVNFKLNIFYFTRWFHFIFMTYWIHFGVFALREPAEIS